MKKLFKYKYRILKKRNSSLYYPQWSWLGLIWSGFEAFEDDVNFLSQEKAEKYLQNIMVADSIKDEVVWKSY